MFLEKPQEILIAKNNSHNIDAYLKLLFGHYAPNKVVMIISEGEDYKALTANLLKGKKVIDQKVTSYVCRNFECSLPVFSVSDLQKLLE